MSMIADSGKATRYKFNLRTDLYLNHLKEIVFFSFNLRQSQQQNQPNDYICDWYARDEL